MQKYKNNSSNLYNTNYYQWYATPKLKFKNKKKFLIVEMFGHVRILNREQIIKLARNEKNTIINLRVTSDNKIYMKEPNEHEQAIFSYTDNLINETLRIMSLSFMHNNISYGSYIYEFDETADNVICQMISRDLPRNNKKPVNLVYELFTSDDNIVFCVYLRDKQNNKIWYTDVTSPVFCEEYKSVIKFTINEFMDKLKKKGKEIDICTNH